MRRPTLAKWLRMLAAWAAESTVETRRRIAGDHALRTAAEDALHERLRLHPDSWTVAEITSSFVQLSILSEFCSQAEVDIGRDAEWLHELGLTPATALFLDAPIEAMKSELRRYGHGGPLAGYFHEWIATATDSTRRRTLGAYYTPYPIAQLLVSLGLKSASDETLIIDPACGSGLFLHALREHFAGKTSPARRPPILGLEIEAASATCAAWLTGGDGVSIRKADSLAVESTTATDGPPPSQVVIIGNPPYSNFGKRDESPALGRLMKDYKRDLGERKHNLNDLYIKFIRWGQHQVELAGAGCVAFVVNNSFLDGLTHRVMRESLVNTFDSIHVVDLRGSVNREAHDNDENVFAIRQGVAIVVLRKSSRAASDLERKRGRVDRVTLQGPREAKLNWLARSAACPDAISWDAVDVAAPDFKLAPPREQATVHPGPVSDELPSLADVVQTYSSGVQTKWDRLFVDMDRDVLAERIRAWFDDRSSWDTTTPAWLRKKAEGGSFNSSHIQRYMTAPLDVRYVYYDPALIGRARFGTMKHMLAGAIGMAFMRQSKNAGEYDHFLAVDCLVSDRVFYSAHGAPFLAPWSLSADKPAMQNFRPEQLNTLRARTGCCEDTPELARRYWCYLYGVFHSNRYRVSFADRLRVAFPPIPLPATADAFTQVSELGARLIECHLAACRPVAKTLSRDSDGPAISRRVEYDESGDSIRVSPDAFVSAPRRAYECRVGGYHVLRRWLVQRAGQPFTMSLHQELQQRIQHLDAALSVIDELNESTALEPFAKEFEIA